MGPGHSEQHRPERSRNAKAQARHRAKRKAYIEQLEQTVTKLQMALGYTPEELETLPPPLNRIRELEQENARLQKDNEDLRRMVTDSGRVLPPDLARRPHHSLFTDPRPITADNQMKRRKTLGSMDGTYTTTASSGDTITHIVSDRPPPLAIPPQPLTHSHSYPYIPAGSSTGTHASAGIAGGSSSIFNLHGAPFQMPNTPSSSANSSPPFSPASLQEPLPLTTNHRSSSAGQLMMTNYKHTQRQHQYDVKLEEERYSTHHSPGPPNHIGHYDSTQHTTTHTHNTAYNPPESTSGQTGHHAQSHAASHAHPSMTDNQWSGSYDTRGIHHGLHR